MLESWGMQLGYQTRAPKNGTTTSKTKPGATQTDITAAKNGDAQLKNQTTDTGNGAIQYRNKTRAARVVDKNATHR